jgi:hypothetical protein
MKNLVKELQKTAARRLQNTRGVPRSMQTKVELIEIAFGRAEILEDFEKYCEEVAGDRPLYPVFDYLRAIDSRLGGEPRVDPRDERVSNLQSITYELTGFMPRNVRGIRETLKVYEVDEIVAALKEYALTLDERDLKPGINAFFDGGATAIIAARRGRANVSDT